MFPFGSNLAAAIQAYEKKIHEKSVKGDYRVLEKDYSGENNDPKAK
jgi:poly [ADP-ribose] polymerase